MRTRCARRQIWARPSKKLLANEKIKLAMAQVDCVVGAIDANVELIVDCITRARDQLNADIVLFPELAIAGYPPEDLLLRDGFLVRCSVAMDKVKAATQGIDAIVGHPLVREGDLYNAATWFRDGKVIGEYAKQLLPNYAVFDEKRYFDSGDEPLVVELKGARVGLIICEDSWEPGPTEQVRDAGAEILLIPNASPYHRFKRKLRAENLSERVESTGMAMAYLNLVGGQDELVFDGGSFVVSAGGTATAPAVPFGDALLSVDYDVSTRAFSGASWQEDSYPSELACIYQALVRGTRDYVLKNGFKKVLLGLSGGIDSALTLAIAVDGLGAENVHAVMMPSRYTSDLSIDLAREQADWLDVRHSVLSIEEPFKAFLSELDAEFSGYEPDTTEENLQSRCRAAMLMALSNKHGSLLLTTGNKSEMAVGYATIYGDMCGGFAPIKDCAKTLVYELADYRNGISKAIPQGVIDRPPTAELADGQTDQDSLPPYDILDDIIARYVERDEPVDQIVATGHDRDVVLRVVRLVLINEYKRRQSAPGVRVTPRAFGRDRRYPITSGWRGY